MSALSANFHGLLISYNDDQSDNCVRLALKRKSRVRYKCMDTFSNFLAFGTTSGAIYLFKLKSVSHSSCHLVSMIPCDQGSIEVIKFLPNPQTDDLLVAIGTSRGSLIIFRLNQLPGDEDPSCNEIYRAETFTNQQPIKLIECDQDLIDLTCPFTKLYICDTADRLYVLDNNAIYGQKQSLRLFYSSNLPALIFSSNESRINQISVNRSQLLISTHETTMLFNEQSQQLNVIGKKKRKEGFFGACFFNPNYKPARILRMTQHSAQNTSFSSMNSISDVDNLYLFVARPVFRLWQVNTRREVMFTHQFEPMIKCEARFNQLVEISNEPVDEDQEDNPGEVLGCLVPRSNRSAPIKGDHFERLIQIYSSTLGNLLLSYTRHEIFVIDPIGAKLIVWHQQDEPIIQVSCNENEVFVWSMTGDLEGAGAETPRFRIKRMIIMATTQFVLELHRLHRFTTVVYLVEMFEDLFRQRMALPLSGSHVITTEGGLLRNILLNAWEMYQSKRRAMATSTARLALQDEEAESSGYERCIKFKGMIDEILDESRRLKDSYADLTGSRFFLTMTNENIDRLCTEPYASLISLEVSIKDLHTTHVIHFNKDAVERRKSVANLSQSIQNLARLSVSERKLAKSSLDLRRAKGPVRGLAQGSQLTERPGQALTGAKSYGRVMGDVIREPLEEAIEDVDKIADYERMLSEQRRVLDTLATKELLGSSSEDEADESNEEPDRRQLFKCSHCGWPRPKSHLLPLSTKQRVQLKCIEENLLVGFAENMGKIEELAFEHGLWPTYLRCLASRNALDEYILCCMMLDDARLFDLEQFLIVHGGEEEILGRMMLLFRDNPNFSNTSAKLKFCVRCKTELEPATSATIGDQSMKFQDEHPDFNLVILFDQFIMRRNANVTKIVNVLLKYTDLLNNIKIPSSFYLKAIATATLVANQSPLNRARLGQLRATSFTNR